MPARSRKDLPVALEGIGLEARAEKMGTMNVGWESWPKGDLSDLFKGLPHGCEAAHYGYVLRGRASIRYPQSGAEETITEGQLYYIPPGHTMNVLEPLEIVEFTPGGSRYEKAKEAFAKNYPKWLATRAKATPGPRKP